MLRNEVYMVWKIREYLEYNHEELTNSIKHTVFSIPYKGDRYLIEEIYIHLNFFFIIATNLDNIGIGNGTIEEFAVFGDTVLSINQDQSTDIRGNRIEELDDVESISENDNIDKNEQVEPISI
jgi:hypothetical protein